MCPSLKVGAVFPLIIETATRGAAKVDTAIAIPGLGGGNALLEDVTAVVFFRWRPCRMPDLGSDHTGRIVVLSRVDVTPTAGLPSLIRCIIPSGPLEGDGLAGTLLKDEVFVLLCDEGTEPAGNISTSSDGRQDLSCTAGKSAMTGDVTRESWCVQCLPLIRHPIFTKHPTDGVGLGERIAGLTRPGINDDFADVVGTIHIAGGVDVPDLLMLTSWRARGLGDDFADVGQERDTPFAVAGQARIAALTQATKIADHGDRAWSFVVAFGSPSEADHFHARSPSRPAFPCRLLCLI